MQIGRYKIDSSNPPFVIAELSANHGNKLEHALNTIKAAKEAGAHAIKIQTYTADTLTIPCSNRYFQIKGGTLWDGKTLYDLYKEASTPWEWHEALKDEAEANELEFFSTPFDSTAVDFLEKLSVPVYKVASFELVDLPLIKRIARTRKPIILSTGMATLEEIEDAVGAAKGEGNSDLCLLKCTSAYPASPQSANLKAIQVLKERFGLPVGLSDHTMGTAVPVAAVALGALVIEKHFTLSRKVVGPDSSFSLEPAEFKKMTDDVRIAWESLGKAQFGVGAEEKKSVVFRRSLFVVKDVKAGETFTQENVRSIRPGNGLPPKQLEEILGQKAAIDIPSGTPMSWDAIEK